MSRFGVSRFPKLERVAVWVFVLTCLMQAATGVLFKWILGIPLEGYLLLLHVSLGGLFTVNLALLVLLWAQACRLDGRGTGKKICFWLMTLAGLGLILSAVLSMFPLLGTAGQHWMVSAHGISTYLAIAAALGYAIVRLTGERAQVNEEAR